MIKTGLERKRANHNVEMASESVPAPILKGLGFLLAPQAWSPMHAVAITRHQVWVDVAFDLRSPTGVQSADGRTFL